MARRVNRLTPLDDREILIASAQSVWIIAETIISHFGSIEHNMGRLHHRFCHAPARHRRTFFIHLSFAPPSYNLQLILIPMCLFDVPLLSGEKNDLPLPTRPYWKIGSKLTANSGREPRD